MLTRFSYAPYEFIRQIEAVGRINTDALDLNATVRGQNSSQTALVESSNEANRDINEIKNNITNTISPEMENLSGIYKILSHVTGVGANITGVVSSNPLLNKIVGGAWSIGGPALIAYGAIKGAKMMYGLARGVMGATGAGAGATATGAGATATGAGAAAGILPKVLKFGGGVLGGISGAYNVYDGIKNWDSNGSTLNKGLRIGQIGTGIAALAALLAAPFTGGTSLLPLVGALGLGSGLLGLGADATAGSKLEESAKRGASEEQPNYFTSPEIVNKLTQIQVICQSLYGVACMNKQANTFARMDTVSASYK
jgi:hypothetical protein